MFTHGNTKRSRVSQCTDQRNCKLFFFYLFFLFIFFFTKNCLSIFFCYRGVDLSDFSGDFSVLKRTVLLILGYRGIENRLWLLIIYLLEHFLVNIIWMYLFGSSLLRHVSLGSSYCHPRWRHVETSSNLSKQITTSSNQTNKVQGVF